MDQIERTLKQESLAARIILVVEADPDVCNFLSSVLRARGFQANPVLSVMDALKWVEYVNPDVIILDETMPEMDNCETYQQLRNRSSAPIIFLATLNAGKVAARALASGIDGHRHKLLPMEELIARIEILVGNVQPSCPISERLWQSRAIAMRPTISVIIPTYNEAENLPLVLPYLPMNLIDEIILVDGRSTDGTVEVARQMLPAIKVLMEKKPGKGAALLAGYMASSGEIIIVVDADGSNDPREIPRFIQALAEGADFVKGSRFASGGGTTDMSRFRRIGNSFLTGLVNLLFNGTYSDLCYGYHGFWRYCLEALDLQDVDGFEIDTALYVQAMRARLKIIEVPSFEGYRFHGVGKLRAIPDGLRVLRTIFNEYFQSTRKPDQDLYLGFRGGPIAGQEWFAISIIDEPVEHR